MKCDLPEGAVQMLGARCDYQAPRKGGSRLASTRKDPGRRIQSRRTNNSGLGSHAGWRWAVVPSHSRHRTWGTCHPAHNPPLILLPFAKSQPALRNRTAWSLQQLQFSGMNRRHKPKSTYVLEISLGQVIASGTVRPSGSRPPPGSSGATAITT